MFEIVDKSFLILFPDSSSTNVIVIKPGPLHTLERKVIVLVMLCLITYVMVCVMVCMFWLGGMVDFMLFGGYEL